MSCLRKIEEKMLLQLNAIYVFNLKHCNAKDCIEISEHLCTYITRFIGIHLS
jgi:hypothetical protein